MNKKIISLMLVLFSILQLFTTNLVLAKAEKANLEEGTYRIIAANNQTYCIAISTSKYEDGVSRPSKNEDAKAVLSYFVDKDVYKFKVEKVGDKYRFRAVHSNKVLTAVKKGVPIVQKDENGSAEQLFDVIKNSNGTVSIYSNNGYAVDVSGESKKQGAEILLWDKTGKANQQFKFVPMNNEVLDSSEVPDNLPNNFLTVTDYPKKTLYEVGETFDYTGLVAYWKRSGKTIKLSPEDFEFTMGDKNTPIHQGTPFTKSGYQKIKMKSLTANQKATLVINVVPKGTMYATAVPSSSKVMVEGKDVAFDAYNIGGSNYFKVRDVAMAINTGKNHFDIEYDAPRNIMKLKRQTAYSAVGGELKTGTAEPTTAVLSSTLMYVQDILCSIKGYNINGSNYFGLRELSKIVDMELGWNGAENCIYLNGNEYYQTGELWESSKNQFMTVVRGLRLGYCSVDAMKRLYGEPTEILEDYEVWGHEEIKDAKYNEEPYEDVKYGNISYYVYTQDYKNLLVAYVLAGYVVGVYTHTDESIKCDQKYYDKIDKLNYASLITDYSKFNTDDLTIYNKNQTTNEKLCFYSTNALRARKGYHILEYSPPASKVARKYAMFMSENDFLSHQGIDGSTPTSRLMGGGVDFEGVAENIDMASGGIYTTGFDHTNIWYNSPGHRKNIFVVTLHKLGVGIAVHPSRIKFISDEETYSEHGVQMFY